MTNTLTFTCSICGEPSTAICAYCTKDACANHVCERCGRCSDCCECEVRLEEPVEVLRNGAQPVTAGDAEHASGETPAQPQAPDESIEPHQPVAADSVQAPAVESAPPDAPAGPEHHE